MGNVAEMIIYHGSDCIVDNPKILESLRPLDFGGGFYLTSNKQQAIAWAKRVAYRKKTALAHISSYKFDLSLAKKSLKIIQFDKPNKEWLQFVCKNRRKRPITTAYDIVIGPVADDSVYETIIAFENGLYDQAETLKRLKVEKLADQILFHTSASLEFIRFLNSEVVKYE